MTFTYMKRLIVSKTKTKEEAMQMSDVFLMAGRITTAQYDELVTLINTTYGE